MRISWWHAVAIFIFVALTIQTGESRSHGWHTEVKKSDTHKDKGFKFQDLDGLYEDYFIQDDFYDDDDDSDSDYDDDYYYASDYDSESDYDSDYYDDFSGFDYDDEDMSSSSSRFFPNFLPSLGRNRESPSWQRKATRDKKGHDKVKIYELEEGDIGNELHDIDKLRDLQDRMEEMQEEVFELETALKKRNKRKKYHKFYY